MSNEFKRGCHAVAVGVEFADAEVLKFRAPMTFSSVAFQVRRHAFMQGNTAHVKLIAIRPRGTCKWTLYYGWRPVMKHHELDVIRMRVVLEGLENV